MTRFSKLAAAVSALPILVALTPLASATGYGQLEQGDIYSVKDVTTNSAFADNISVACGDTVAFRVRIDNGGPETLTNIKVSATLNGASSTSHGLQVSLRANNNIDNMTVTANAGVNTAQATTAAYVNGSTQLLNYSTTPGGESVLKNLPDGILSGGINIGSIGPLTTDTEEVQFQAKVSCPQPPVKQYVCKGADVKQIDRTHFDFTAYADVQNVKVESYTFTVKDSDGNVVDTQTVDTSALSAVYHFNQSKPDTYTVTAVVNTDSGTTDVGNCVAKITVKSTPPVTPPQVLSTTVLPNTGPGNVIELFAGASTLGTAGHYIVSRRRRS